MFVLLSNVYPAKYLRSGVYGGQSVTVGALVKQNGQLTALVEADK